MDAVQRRSTLRSWLTRFTILEMAMSFIMCSLVIVTIVLLGIKLSRMDEEHSDVNKEYRRAAERERHDSHADDGAGPLPCRPRFLGALVPAATADLVLCAVSVLARRHAITTAECARRARALFGDGLELAESCTELSGCVRHQVAALREHPRYARGEPANNVALVSTEDDMVLAEQHYAYVTSVFANEMIVDGDQLLLLSWKASLKARTHQAWAAPVEIQRGSACSRSPRDAREGSPLVFGPAVHSLHSSGALVVLAPHAAWIMCYVGYERQVWED